jgi:lysophospholipase L1-like esterase
LDRFLTSLASSHIPIQVILTPQNLDFLGDLLEPAGFAKNKKFLATFLNNPRYQGLRYEDWSNRYPSDLFLDHCHLTPEGNKRLASDLMGLLKKENP